MLLCRGMTYSLRPQQIVYVLPGTGYTEKDLHAMYEQAQVNTDTSLLETAWEVRSRSRFPVNTSCRQCKLYNDS